MNEGLQIRNNMMVSNSFFFGGGGVNKSLKLNAEPVQFVMYRRERASLMQRLPTLVLKYPQWDLFWMTS